VSRWDLDGLSINLGGTSVNADALPLGHKPLLSGDQEVDKNLVLAYAATKGMQDCLPLRGYELDNVVARLPSFHAASDAEGLQVQDLANFMSECFKFINTPTRLHLARQLVATLFSISHLDHLLPGTDEGCFRLLHLPASLLIIGDIPGDAHRPMLITFDLLRLPEIFINLEIHCEKKHFFLAKNDVIGVSGQEVAVGDRVVALFGATDIYLLRPISLGGVAENRPGPGPAQEQVNVRMRGYTLVSRCFIQGITNGTKPLPVERMDTQQRVFEIW
jgi:hypothetical protein